jgi:hypothetical protein
MYRWELDDSVQPDFGSLPSPVRMAAANFMDAVVLVDPLEYQRHPGEPADANKLLRTLHFGLHHEGLITFLIYPPDDLVLVVRIQWLGD